LSCILTLLHFAPLNAQNLGAYYSPFDKQQLDKNLVDKWTGSAGFIEAFLSNEKYADLSLEQKYERTSLGGKHYTFQVYYKGLAIEQVFIKILIDNSQDLRLIQSNLPDIELWSTITYSRANTAEQKVYLFHENRLTPCLKESVLDEKTDTYAERFWVNESLFYENNLKFHSDTTAYAKVFQPDPLTSSGMSYGGNYQDAFSFDTTGLLIQNMNNPGGNTITANSTNYNYYGQSFNIPTESYVNNFSDPIIRQVFESIFLNGQGVVIGFNTAITNDVSSYVTSITIGDYNYPALEQELVWGTMPVDFSGGNFNLSNSFFIISEFSAPFTNPNSSFTDTFNFNRSQIDFEDVNAFYHLNNFKAHWESLGFTDLASEVILIDAHGNNGADNSFFTPTSPPRLVFGQGGVDDAEDADVLIHEYGHAISAFASPSTNVDSERRALDEGFGDYLASSYSKQYSNFNSNDVFSWDGHNEFWSGRISNSNKTKLDISSSENIYFNGEVWSTTLNDLYTELGAVVTDKLAIEVMYYNMPNTTISQAARNLFLADTLIYNGIHSCEIFDVLFARKFLQGSCTDFYTGLRPSHSRNKGVQLLNTYGFTNYNQDLTLLFEGANYANSQLQVFDVSGKLIRHQNIEANSEKLNFPDLPGGIYFIEVRTDEQIYRFKVLKS
jgi:hypothetical protein